MKFLDVFAGIGGFRLGMEMAGHEPAGWIEWDKAARKSYESIHETGDEWNAKDIRTVTAEQLPKADIWCGGWPCQDISKNGKQSGIKGDRSGLFYSATRLIEQLKEKNKPKYLFLENVENLLRINDGFDFLQVLIELDRIGYDAEWQSINSREHGVPQNRQRVYIIGHLRGRTTSQVFPIRKRDNEVDLQRESDGWKVKNATKKGYDIATPADAVNLAFPDSKTRRGRVGKGYLQTLDRSCYQAVYDPKKEAWRRITPREAFRAQGFPDWAYEKAAAVCDESQLYSQAGNSVTVNVIYEIAKRLK